MAHIVKILQTKKVKRGDSEVLVVIVQLDDGSECTVYVGGQVEAFFTNGQSRAFVKRNQ